MEHTPHVTPIRTYLMVFAALMVLLAVTVVVAFFDFGYLNLLIALSIAVTKAGLIMVYFMHLKGNSKLVWIFAGLGFYGLVILVLIAMGDYVARGGIVPSLP